MFESLSATVVTAVATLLGVRIAVTKMDREDVSRAETPQIAAYPVIVAEPPKARRIPHYQPPKLAVVSTAKAADLLIDWANGEGYVGLYTASEIDEHWKTACAMLDLVELDVRFVREALESRGLKVGKKRLNTPEYVHIRERTGKDRLVLYRIPKVRMKSEIGPDQPDGDPGHPSQGRPSAGPVPARARNDSDFRRVA